MRSNISKATRKLIASRANFRCEYCRKPEIISNFSFHVEHIIGRQHGGTDNISNLAYACSKYFVLSLSTHCCNLS